MTQRPIDQAIEELHLKLVEVLDKPEAFQEAIRTTLQTERRQADERESELRQEVKSLEQSWMGLKDEYSTLARLLGFDGNSWFGDPLVPHAEIVSRLKEVVAKATQADERLREVVGEILTEVGNYNDGCGCCSDGSADKHIKAIAAKHNIDITPNTPQV